MCGKVVQWSFSTESFREIFFVNQTVENVGFFHRRRVYIGDYTTSGKKSNPKKSPSARRARVIFWLLFATSGIICQYTRVSGERTALFNRKWRHKPPFNFTENLPAVKEWSLFTTRENNDHSLTAGKLHWGFFLTGGYSNDGAYDWIMGLLGLLLSSSWSHILPFTN